MEGLPITNCGVFLLTLNASGLASFASGIPGMPTAFWIQDPQHPQLFWAPVLFALGHYAILGALTLLSYGVGRLLTRGCDYASTWEEISFSVPVGLGLLAYLTFTLGVIGCLYRGVACAAIAILSVLCTPVWLELGTRFARWLRNAHVKWTWLFGILILAVILLPILLLPLYPPTAFDATMYHLAEAKQYTSEHRMGFNPYIRFNAFPQVNEMLFTLMLLLFDDIAAQQVQFLMMGLLAATLYSWALRWWDRTVGLWAVALWLSNPLILWLGSVAYVEIGLAVFVTLGAYALFNWLDTDKRSWLVASAVCWGFAAGSKYLALFPLLLAGLFVLYVGLKQRRYNSIAVFCLVIALLSAPWYVRSFHYTGNPVFPYLASTFGYGHWSVADVASLHWEQSTFGTGKTLGSFLSLPWNLSLRAEKFHGGTPPPSPICFLSLPFLLFFAFRDARVRHLFFLALAYILFWFLSVQVLRYLVPVIPLLCLASAAVLHQILWPFGRVRQWVWHPVFALFLSALLLYPGWRYAVAHLKHYGPPPATSAERDSYLAQHLPAYGALAYLNARKGRDPVVYGLNTENLAYFADGQLIGDWFGPARFARIQEQLRSGRALYKELRTLGATFFLVGWHERHIELPQDEFFISHFRLVYAGPYVRLFELVEYPVHPTYGPELLRNPGFEILEDGWPAYWFPGGSGSPSPLVEAYGAFVLGETTSYEGQAAVRVDDRAWWFQRIRVYPGRLYRLSHYTLSLQPDQLARLQVNWLDERANTIIRSDIEVVDVGLEWQLHRMMALSPENATWADVYVSVADGPNVVWFDRFSFVELRYRYGRLEEGFFLEPNLNWAWVAPTSRVWLRPTKDSHYLMIKGWLPPIKYYEKRECHLAVYVTDEAGRDRYHLEHVLKESGHFEAKFRVDRKVFVSGEDILVTIKGSRYRDPHSKDPRELSWILNAVGFVPE